MQANSVCNELLSIALKQPQKIALMIDGQSWTYGELIQQVEDVAHYLRDMSLEAGQIVYQFIDDSLTKIVSSLGIMCADGVCCSFDANDSAESVHYLINQLQGQVAVVQEKTRHRLPAAAVKSVFVVEQMLPSIFGIQDKEHFLRYREDGPAYIGQVAGDAEYPKVVLHTHHSLTASIHANVRWDVGTCQMNSQALLISEDRWIDHLAEVLSPLVVGGTLVLQKTVNQFDMDYLTQTIYHQQATTVTIGLPVVQALLDYLKKNQQLETFKFVRNLCLIGNE